MAVCEAVDSRDDGMNLIYRSTALEIRRIRTCKAAIPCPKCGTRQVYLYDPEPLAVWKCRKCRHKWWFEPLMVRN